MQESNLKNACFEESKFDFLINCYIIIKASNYMDKFSDVLNSSFVKYKSRSTQNMV